ncbi:histone-lysine N-methyltransferase Smyd1-like [Pangasianodon hypophthalmus]|uniref:histone-lysine N-methyltransferase Smyd1-like n=1 Tax=Pangasianodon hypophthalmus TaxID=310915 RepID=UPI00230794EA|nr:histone-lysine N-methyltransferase Smyd1-like [Pangasianodon hypophthalmus]
MRAEIPSDGTCLSEIERKNSNIEFPSLLSLGRLAARIMWRLDKDGDVISELQLTKLNDLEDHISDLPEMDMKELKVDIHNFLDYWPRTNKQHTVDSISHIFGLINCNGFMVSDHKGLQAVGVGLFPNLCLVNHDCWPNCTVILNNGNHSATNTMYHTQKRWVCLATINRPSSSFLVIFCWFNQYLTSSKVPDEKVKEITEYSQEMLKKMEKARIDATTAATYARKMVDGYTKLYNPNNAQLGMAIMRAGVTHWQAGHIEVAHGMICKAYAILLVTHGPTHPITKDLEAMRTQTEMELRMFKQNEYIYHTMREAALKNQPMQMMPEPVEEGIKSLFRKK